MKRDVQTEQQTDLTQYMRKNLLKEKVRLLYIKTDQDGSSQEGRY